MQPDFALQQFYTEGHPPAPCGGGFHNPGCSNPPTMSSCKVSTITGYCNCIHTTLLNGTAESRELLEMIRDYADCCLREVYGGG